MTAPLAHRLRPTQLTDIVGLDDLVGGTTALGRALAAGLRPSLLLSGPPGSGKTTLALALAADSGAPVVTIAAVTDGLQRLREVITEARRYLATPPAKTTGPLVVFVDEIHRWSTTQQEALLQHVESGLIRLIGATTEPLAMAVVPALRSRTVELTLTVPSAARVAAIVERAVTHPQSPLVARRIQLSRGTAAFLASHVDGDIRRALMVLEIAAASLPDGGEVRSGQLLQLLGTLTMADHRPGLLAEDLLSAFHKTIRDSDPDAAVYWLARAAQSGADARVYARRLLAIATEDIGLADPQALVQAEAAWATFEAVGPAEGWRAIAQAALYCATAPKSDRVQGAWQAAQQLAAATPQLPVPTNLWNRGLLQRNPADRQPYVWPFDAPGGVTTQPRRPAEVADVPLYQPGDRGYEKTIAQRLAWWAAHRGQPDGSEHRQR